MSYSSRQTAYKLHKNNYTSRCWHLLEYNISQVSEQKKPEAEFIIPFWSSIAQTIKNKLLQIFFKIKLMNTKMNKTVLWKICVAGVNRPTY